MPSRSRIAVASMSLSLAMLFGPGLAAHATPSDALGAVKRTGVSAGHDLAGVKRTGDVASVKRTGDLASVKRTGLISADATGALDLKALLELGLLG